MKKLTLASAVLLAFTLPPTMSDAAGNGPNTPKVNGKPIREAATRATNNQTAVACSICFTCGGDWPVFAGSIRSVGDFPTERGAACDGTLPSSPQGRSDGSPFLCCR
ncbi:hypothetical protein [Benzoatithermus flavus]|uniref:Uncharacterized protein n=1 Tax=Benzoatithermus flavus TaxID=3108223 RepID=A0ABU8XSF4_9PROT